MGVVEGIDDAVLVRLLLGPMIGDGKQRQVFALRRNSDSVLKVERPGSTQHNNIAEHQLWTALRHTPLGVWLAPCRDISPCGRAMLQRRCEPLRRGDAMPGALPEVLAGDAHDGNLGLFEGRIVFVDYAHALPALAQAAGGA